MPIPKFANFDPGRIVLVVNGVQIVGFADGSFVKVSRQTPSFASKAGADGHVVRTRSRDKRGKIEITLLPSSPSNAYLSTLMQLDENTIGGIGAVGPTFVKDLNGTTIAAAAESWVTQPADIEYSNEPVNRTWTLECADVQMLVGQNLV